MRTTLDINFYGTMNLIEALRETGLDSHILFVGSVDEYGAVSEKYIPIKEDCPLNPLSPYAASKTSADMLCYSYVKTYGINIVRVRPFNHTGPGQRSEFVCSERTYSIRWILHTLLEFTKLSVEIKEDSSKLRSVDLTFLKGNCSKFRAITGWKSTISFEKTLNDILNYWGEKIPNRNL